MYLMTRTNQDEPRGIPGPAAGGAAGEAPAPEQIARLLADFRGVMGVAARDLVTGETIEVDADTRFPTASTIKTAVMLEAYHRAAAGDLRFDEEIALREEDKVGGSGVLNGLHAGVRLSIGDLVHLMIVLSDNTATNLLVERLGTARINDRLLACGLRQTKLFRPTFRDGRADVHPDLEREFGLGMTTPREMAALMAIVAEGRAVGPDASSAMRQTLERQQDRAMIPRFIAGEAGVRIGNKTGTDQEKHAGADGRTRHVRADAAIVTTPGTNYVIAVYARQVEDGRWGVENDAVVTAARISRIIYDHFTRR
jgi:beta-lactamase class A